MDKTTIQDLTTGNVKKQLLAFAIPMIAASLLQALYGIVDMLVAGQFIGSDGISAITNSSQITLMVTNIATGLTTGGNILASQYFGNKDEDNRIKASGTIFSLFFLIGIVCAILLFFFSRPILIQMGAPSLAEAVSYLRICSIGLVFTFIYNALSAIMRAVGDSKTPSRFIMSATLINIILDIVFMGPCNMGVAGAALATIIAQAYTAIAGFIFLARHPEVFHFTFENLKLHADKCKTICKLGFPLAVQMTAASISWLTITFLVNKYGVDVSAGSGVSAKIKDISQLFINCLTNAAATMIAQNLGAGLFDRAKKILHEGIKLALTFSIFMILIIELGAPFFVSLFSNNVVVIQTGALNLRIEILGQIFYSFFMLYHALAIGSGHSHFALFSSFVNCILVRIVLAVWFNQVFGLVGIFIACAIAPLSSVPLGIIFEKTGVWKKSMVKKG